jgi:hypothetical protein
MPDKCPVISGIRFLFVLSEGKDCAHGIDYRFIVYAKVQV